MYFVNLCLIRLQPIPSNLLPSFLSHVVITRHACRSFAAAVSCDCTTSSSSSNIIQNTFKRLPSFRSQHRRPLISQVVFCNTFSQAPLHVQHELYRQNSFKFAVIIVWFDYSFSQCFLIRRVLLEMCAVVFALYN